MSMTDDHWVTEHNEEISRKRGKERYDADELAEMMACTHCGRN